MTRLGLVGVGRWGQRYIETFARRQAEGRPGVITCFSRRRDLDDLTIPGASRVRDWHEIIGERRCDGLIIATPPDSHLEIATAAVQAGLPVLIEKPLALSAAEVIRMLAVMRAVPRVPVLVNHIDLYSPYFRTLKRLVQERGIEVDDIQSTVCGPGPHRDHSALHDYAPHALAMVFELQGRGEPSPLRSVDRVRNGTGEMFAIHLELRHADARVCIGNGAATKQRVFRAEGSGHRIVYDDGEPRAAKVCLDGNPMAVEHRPPLDVVIDEFVDAIERARAGSIDAARCREDVLMALAVAEIVDEVGRRLVVA